MNSQIQKIIRQLDLIDNRTLNKANFFVSVFVLGSGLILFIKFHVGTGAFRKEWLGLGKDFWMFMHQAAGALFFIGTILHIWAYRRYIIGVIRKWGEKLPAKLKSRIRWQILLLIMGIVVLWAGFFPWAAMPDATLEDAAYHYWIDIHARVGLFF